MPDRRLGQRTGSGDERRSRYRKQTARIIPFGIEVGWQKLQVRDVEPIVATWITRNIGALHSRSNLLAIPSRGMVSEFLENVLRASLSPQWGEGRAFAAP